MARPISYRKWIIKFAEEESHIGDLARDIRADPSFPKIPDRGIIKKYLANIGACENALIAFDKSWWEFKDHKISKNKLKIFGELGT